jgi:hypothetical protein
VLLLVNHFAAKFAGELARPTPRSSDAALTREAAEISGITYVLDVDREEANLILQT